MDKPEKKAKKTKVVGVQQYINTSTGELEDFTVTSIEDHDFDFYKVWMKNFIFTMDAIGNQKTKLCFWIIDNLNKENQLTMTYRQIAEAAGVSLETVRVTMNKLIDSNFLHRQNQGCYVVNSDILFKETTGNRMNVLNIYQNADRVDEIQTIEHQISATKKSIAFLSDHLAELIQKQKEASINEQDFENLFKSDVEVPDNKPNKTMGTLSKSRFQTFMGENQNATELTFDAVSYDGMAYTDVSEEGDGSVLAFMDGDTMHVTAANGGKVLLPEDSSKLFITSTQKTRLPSIKTVNMSNCDTSKVANTGWMFAGCTSLTEIKGLENWSTSKVTTMSHMFSYCTSLTEIKGIENWDTSNTTNINNIFLHCCSLKSLDLSNWDTSKIKRMYGVFCCCSHLTQIKGLNTWNTSSVIVMAWMFCACSSIVSLDLSGWRTENLTGPYSTYRMFDNCSTLTEIKLDGEPNKLDEELSDGFILCGNTE